MSTTTSAPQRPTGVPDTSRLQGRVARTSPLHRVALRLAFALLLWSTRPQRPPRSHEEVHRHRQELLARAERERLWLLHSHSTYLY